MGRYFGIKNYSRAEGVSDYWKGSPPSPEELISIAEKLGWDINNDRISSESYCDFCLWNGKEFVYKGFNGYNDAEEMWKDPELAGFTVNTSRFKIFDMIGNPTSDTTFFCN